jgi:homoserine O-succinyltransferase/O-acetyltransferase
MTPKLRLCLSDMNNGVPNQAVRCFRVLVEDFFARVRERNPRIETKFLHVQPRNLQELPPNDCDFYLSSGGPGGPFDHDGEGWLDRYRSWLDHIVDRNIQHGDAAPGLLGVCYTFELLIRHFAVSDMVPRARRKFGVMPVYMTPEGEQHPLTSAFGDRLFAFEHRNWEAVDLDDRKLRELGGSLLAQESRDGVSKGRALLALDFAPGVVGTQFHPEADRGGVVAWLQKREQAEAFIEAYGSVTYQRMIRTLDNPQRLARTFSVFIPGWLTRRFNALAAERDWNLLETPSLDTHFFDGDAPSAAAIAFPSLLPGHTPRAPQLDFDDAAPSSDGHDFGHIAPHFDSSIPPLREELQPLQEELDPAALGEQVLGCSDEQLDRWVGGICGIGVLKGDGRWRAGLCPCSPGGGVAPCTPSRATHPAPRQRTQGLRPLVLCTLLTRFVDDARRIAGPHAPWEAARARGCPTACAPVAAPA